MAKKEWRHALQFSTLCVSVTIRGNSMNRGACEAPGKVVGDARNRTVALLHHRDGTRRFRSNHDTIGVEKNSNRADPSRRNSGLDTHVNQAFTFVKGRDVPRDALRFVPWTVLLFMNR